MNAFDTADIEAGAYVGEVMELSRRVSPKGHEIVEWRIRILEGKHAGASIVKVFHLRSRQAVDFLKRELALLGASVMSSADFEQARAVAVGKKIRFTASCEPGFPPAYFVQALLTEPVPAELAKPAPTEVDLGW